MGTYSMEMKFGSRYSRGWRDPEQDRKVRTRAAKAGSQSFTVRPDVIMTSHKETTGNE